MEKNKLILGTVQFGLEYGISNSIGKPTKHSIKEILDKAYENNIRILDTAEAYGDSQIRIGDYHKTSKNTFNIITKFNSNVEGLSSEITSRVQANLKVLRVNSFYCYMFHSFDDFKSYYKIFEKELIELKRQGIIKKIGVSIYSNEEFKYILDSNFNIDLIQLPYNLFDNRNRRGKLISKAKAKNIEIHVRSVFLQGLFFKKASDLSGNLSLLKNEMYKIHDIKGDKMSVIDLSLNYVASNNEIDHILIGVDSVDQLNSNIKAMNSEIPLSFIEEIDKIDISETKMLNPSNWN